MGDAKEKQVKIGKLLTYLGANTEIGNAKGYEIQNLVSYLKKENTEDVKLLEGEDIRDAYLCVALGKGGISKSCMRHRRTQNFLDIYVDNPDSVKLRDCKTQYPRQQMQRNQDSQKPCALYSLGTGNSRSSITALTKSGTYSWTARTTWKG